MSVSPFVPLGQVEVGIRRSLVQTGAQLLRAGRAQRLNAYGRAGRPCRRCGALIRTRVFGEFPRRVFWCPRCQPDAGAQPGSPGTTGGPARLTAHEARTVAGVDGWHLRPCGTGGRRHRSGLRPAERSAVYLWTEAAGIWG